MKDKFVEKHCKHHGLTKFVLESRGYYKCRACRMQQVADRRRKCKVELVKELGGKCKLCGYCKCVEALDFHHLDPSTKEFGLGSGKTVSITKLRVEATKCVLLCATCHREVEAGITKI